MLRKIQGDVFNTPIELPILHCIAQDVAMGAGFAKEVVRRYPDIRKVVRNQRPTIQGCYPYTGDDGRTILNLVTKARSNGKPTRADFIEAVETARDFIMSNMNVQEVVMPYIGTGLDRLPKSFVDRVIEDTFETTGLTTTIYVL